MKLDQRGRSAKTRRDPKWSLTVSTERRLWQGTLWSVPPPRHKPGAGSDSSRVLRSGFDRFRFDSVILVKPYRVLNVLASLYGDCLIHSCTTCGLQSRK